jgi:hypothetical protein
MEMAPEWGRQTCVEGAPDSARTASLTILKGFRRRSERLEFRCGERLQQLIGLSLNKR